MSFRNLSLALGVVAISSVAFGQKKIETSAAVEFKNKFLPALGQGNMEGAKKALRAAKGFIDQAAVHPDTENSQKTLWLKGEIYSSYMTVGVMSQDTAFIKEAGEDAIDQSIAAFKKGYPLGKKYKQDIETSVGQKVNQMNGFAGMLYSADQFDEAAEVYGTMAQYNEAINVVDTISLGNASLCYEKGGRATLAKLAEAANAADSTSLTEKATASFKAAAEGYETLSKAKASGVESSVDASRNYRQAGEPDKAKAIIVKARENNVVNKELLLELVNINIEAGDAAGAEKALADAIATDPKNKTLHYTIGTINIDLGKPAEAEASLNKALEIDPDYVDAQYQLGAHLVTWAGDIKLEADGLKFGDPNYNKMKAQSEETYKRALVPLEKYIGNYPDDKAVLNILFQIHRNLGNSDKALEYKKRAEGVK